MALNPLKPITEELAPGVWRHAGDLMHGMNVYLLADEGGVTIFDGGLHYFQLDRIPFRLPRTVYPWLLGHWDGGPAKVSDTVEEGDEIAGFVVKHFPGHAPGMIGLWRESDPHIVAAGHSEPMTGEPAQMRMLLEQAANRG